ncbi:MAG: hypothetical protein MUE95_02660 [Cyclobacteriaceae bacterium]|nr:hypothetical protein [Cyclobacteriaceae bacterium]
MNDTIKQNREMVEEKKKKLFRQKSEHKLSIEPTEDATELNGDYLKQLRKKMLRDQHRQYRYRIIAIAVLLLITLLIFTW